MKHDEKMTSEFYDVTVIGGGSGGLVAARLAAALGAKTLLIDKERLGGDCLHYGCVPSKSLIHVARVAYQVRNAARLGLTTTGSEVDMGKISGYIQGVIKQVEKNEELLTEGVNVQFGEVEFHSASTLTLNGNMVKSRNTIIATGSHPTIPLIEGLAETGYLTNEGTFDLNRLPDSLMIVGGGPIGVELAQAFTRLGTKVVLIQGPERLLPKEDPEVSATIAGVLQAEGVEVITGARLIRARRQGARKVVTVRRGEKEWEREAGELLLALGRGPNVEGLNLEAAGIVYDEKGIKVDSYLQTSTRNVLAIGDVIGGYLFTHVAAQEAGIAVRNALVPVAKKRMDYRVVPWCTFTDPEAARVGLTLKEAQQQYQRVREIKLPYEQIDRAQAENAPTGFLKLVLAGKKDEIVGAHIVGAQAGELLGEIALAMRQRLSLNAIQSTIHTYPTMSTGLQQAVFEAYLQGDAARSNRNLVRWLLSLRR
jgi:pyruvate/2-oxoglutarate dehydrogenase complex dihydrolipoamide dehydrogenase (E3) component